MVNDIYIGLAWLMIYIYWVGLVNDIYIGLAWLMIYIYWVGLVNDIYGIGFYVYWYTFFQTMNILKLMIGRKINRVNNAFTTTGFISIPTNDFYQ